MQSQPLCRMHFGQYQACWGDQEMGVLVKTGPVHWVTLHNM